MESIRRLFDNDHLGQLILSILLAIYLIMGYNLPLPMATIVDSILGKIILFGIVFYMFSNTNPILAVLTLLVAFDMIRRSYISTGNFGLNNFVPSEMVKSEQMAAFNYFPPTLEQEVIAKMAPIYHNGPLTKASYKPYMENLHDASRLNKGN